MLRARVAYSVLGEGASRPLEVSSWAGSKEGAWTADPVAHIGARPALVGCSQLAFGTLLAFMVAGKRAVCTIHVLGSIATEG